MVVAVFVTIVIMLVISLTTLYAVCTELESTERFTSIIALNFVTCFGVLFAAVFLLFNAISLNLWQAIVGAILMLVLIVVFHTLHNCRKGLFAANTNHSIISTTANLFVLALYSIAAWLF